MDSHHLWAVYEGQAPLYQQWITFLDGIAERITPDPDLSVERQERFCSLVEEGRKILCQQGHLHRRVEHYLRAVYLQLSPNYLPISEELRVFTRVMLGRLVHELARSA